MVLGIVVSVGSTAHAETGELWTYPLSPVEAEPVVSPSGQVVMATGNGDSASGTLFQAVSSSGANSWTTPSTGDQTSEVAVFDSSGDAYWVDNAGPNEQTLVASLNGQQLWSMPLGQSIFALNLKVVLGTNGILYLVERNQTTGSDALVGFNRTDGAVVTDQDLGALGISIDATALYELFAYSTGLVVIGPGSVDFFSYSGQLTRSVQAPQGFPYLGITGNVSVSLGGDVFLSYGPFCDTGTTSPGYLARVAPDGSSWSEAAIPAVNGTCGLGVVTALPDGGVAYAGSAYDSFGDGLSVFNSDGSLRWHDDGLFSVPNDPGFPTVYPDPTSWHVDSAGHLIGASKDFLFPNGSQSAYFESIVIFEFDSATGELLDEPIITAANDPTPRDLVPASLISDTNRVYVTGGTPNAPTADPRLWAVSVPGMTGDWPSTSLRTLAGDANSSGEKYIALGDSYSSGEGNAPYFEPKNKCHRSTTAYPTKVDIPFTQQPFETLTKGWGFLACSPATWSDVVTKQLSSKRDKKNTNWLPLDRSTTLVTITVGGDNLDFSGVLNFCYKKFHNCESDPYGHFPTLRAWATAQLASLEPHLVTLYQEIRSRTEPGTAILVLGYPQLLPASTAEQDCLKLQPGIPTHPGLGNDEQTYLRSEDVQLNSTISMAVTGANVNAIFVPVDTEFAGHEVCGSEGEWINGPSITGIRHWIPITPRTTSFHPNSLGQDEYGMIINDYLDGVSPVA